MTPKRFGAGALAVWVILSRVGASTAGAQCVSPCSGPGPVACSVDALNGNDAAGCCTAVTPCKTIQFAVGQVSAGVIKVAAGTYPESAVVSLIIGKTVTLCGARAGVDARTRSGPELESIITNSRGTIVSASHVIVDGFTFEGVTNSVFPFGLDMAAGTEGTQVYNNIFQNNITGIGLANANTPPSQVLICQNLFQNNNNPGASSGTGIYTDQFVCGNVSPPAIRPCTNFLIEQNAFKGNASSGIDLSNTDVTPMTNVDVSTNTFDMNSRAILLFNVDQSTIHNNSMTNSTGTGSGDIRIFGGVDGLTITNNDMSGGAGWAIRMTSDNGPSSDIMIHENNIANYAGSPPVSMFGGGLFVGPGAYPTPPLDATCNWWNDPCGPFNVTNNPAGIGEEVQEAVPSTVNFSPWLIAPGPAPASGTGTCSGTASTCRLTTTTTTTPSSTVPTTTGTPVTTTTTSTAVVPSTTSTTLPPEICGNCLDDDGNGLIDFEDPACCSTVQPLTVTQASFHPAKSTLHIRVTFPDGTFAGLDPRQQDVHLQVRDASGELVCSTIPAAGWQKLFQRTFGFFDQRLTVSPPIKCLSLSLPSKGKTGATITAAGVKPGSPLMSPLEITLNIDHQCAAGPLSVQQKAEGWRVFP
jgi:Right handed beta helix region